MGELLEDLIVEVIDQRGKKDIFCVNINYIV